MTNWMTAAGLAFIAGGIATLISFRAVLFRAGQRRAGRRGRRRAGGEPLELVAAPATKPAREDRRERRGERRGRREGSGGLASIGLADDDLAESDFAARIPAARNLAAEDLVAGDLAARDLAADDFAAGGRTARDLAAGDFVADTLDGEHADEDFFGDEARMPHPVMDRIEERVAGDIDEDPDDLPPAEDDPPVVIAPRRADVPAWAVEGPSVDLRPWVASPPEDGRVDRSGPGYGDRVDGWVRPKYRSLPEHSPAGEYWTPVPDLPTPDPEPSARGYGWPVPVERLPPVPAYEPATGFDLAAVPPEPTEVVSMWPRDDERPGRIRLPRSWSTRNEKRRAEAVADQPPPRRRPRPRPRPVAPADDDTQVYVSRHAAEPPR